MTQKEYLLISSYDTRRGGGLSTFVRMMAREAKRAGYVSHIIDEQSFPRGPLYFKKSVRNIVYLINHARGIQYYTQYTQEFLKTNLAPFLMKQNIFFHIQDITALHALRQVRGELPKRVLLTVHGDYTNMLVSDEYISERDRAWFEHFEREAYRIAPHIVTVDTRLAHHVKRLSGREATIIRNPVDTHRFSPVSLDRVLRLRKKKGYPPHIPIFLVPRRLVKKNGVHIALLAFKEYVKENGEGILLLIGDGPERETLQRIAQSPPLSGRVYFLGDIPYEDVPDYMALADGIIIPSIPSAGVIEATSIAALEGMATGKPVIASNLGGLKEIIQHEKTGLLVTPGDVKGFARAYAYALEKKELLGRNARAYVEKYHSIEKIFNKYVSLMDTQCG